ncbi:MAG TPA: DUF3551 domain-containing protein [Xanthobacteraceae bacterium]|nr:DUF3551 domain-containing protein [Xanthobacteraceae bacterium]
MTRIVFLVAAAAATLCFNALPSRADTYGNAPWCAVRSLGYGDVEWDCEYASAAECAPTVIAGNRGFCNQNPYYVAPYRPVAPWHPRHHIRRRVHRQ